MRNTISLSMLPSLKSFQCPSCNKSFTSRDPSRLHNVTRFPLILKCGHTVCESCLKNKKKVICPVCQDCTEFEDGNTSKLVPDVYVLGLVSMNLKHAVPNVKMKPASNPVVPDLNHSGKEAIVTCDICSSKEASFRCDKCEDNFCNTCFDTSHKSRGKSLQKHIGIPVYSSVYRTMVQSGCQDHEGKAIEFFCEEDNVLICSLCVVTGSHKGHPVLTLLEKNQACAANLSKIKDAAALTIRRLRFTEHKISQAIPGEKMDCTEWIKQVHDHFHSLHTALTLRENEMVEKIESISQTNVTHLEKLRQDISDLFKDFNSVIRDAELVLQNPTVSVSVPTLIEKLESAQRAPCHLCPIEKVCKEDEKISISFEPNLLKSIRDHGKIDSDIKLKFCLKSNDELPEDFVAEVIPDDSTHTDNESVSSDSFSEDSLNTIANSNKVLPMKLNYYASMQEKVQISCVQDPSCFYVVKSSEVRKLNTLSEKMNKWCRATVASKHTPDVLKEGDLYLIRFSEDNKWYRGRVLSIEPLPEVNSSIKLIAPSQKQEQKAKVFYVDFGNTDIVPISRMRNIQTQFLNLPSMAKRCSLHGIVPYDGKWSAECISTFRNFVHNKEVTMQVIEEREGILYVDLSQSASLEVAHDVPVSVRDALVFLEFGCLTDGSKAKKSKRLRNIKSFYPPEEIRANVKTNVLVSHAESPSRFYVQQLSTSRHLSDLILAMKKFYEDDTNILHSVYVPYIGMMCAARYSKDGFWYRAEVIGLPGGAKVEVLYVDFGNKEVIHHRYIRKLMDRYTKLSSQAITCCLADVSYAHGSTWTTEATKWLITFVEKKHLTLLSLGMIPSNKITKSVLYFIQPEVGLELCINALLVKNGHAVASGPYAKVASVPKACAKSLPKKSNILAPQHPAMKNTILTRTESESSSSSLSPSSAPVEIPKFEESLVTKGEPENNVKIIVSHIESPGSFFVRIANENEEKFNRLMNTLQDVYSESDCVPDKVSINSSYAVYRKSDGKWYRGLVQEKEGDSYEVQFVDFGFVEKVIAEDFRIILKQHSIEEAFAVECHLADILPAGDSSKWPRAAVDDFKELVSSHEILYLTGKGKREGNSLPGDLFYKELIRGGALEPSKVIFQSISEKLLEKGVVLKARREKNPNVKVLEPPVLANIPASPSSSCDSMRTNSDSPCTVIMAPVSPQKTSESTKQSTVELMQSKPAEQREPVFKWLSAPVPSQTKFLCNVTHISEDGGLFLQSIPENTKKVTLLTNTFQCLYKDAKPEKLRIPPPIGEAVIAKFPLDKKWYRAEIVSDNPNKIKVQFVDFGNFEIVQLDDIHMNITMKDKPRLALEAELHDTMPAEGDSWTENVLDFLHGTLVEEVCICEIMVPPEEGKRLQISLTLKESEINISTHLKEANLAVSLSEYEQIIEEREKTIKSPVQIEWSQIGFQPASSLPLSKLFRACVTNILEPNVVYVQRLKVDDPSDEEEETHNNQVDQFLLLMDDLRASAEEMPPLTNPVEGMACCAQYTSDNNWYRCQIVSVTSSGVNVSYVDYGNSECLPLDRLREPHPRFLKFPIQAHLCKVHGLEPVEEDWTPTAAKKLLEMFQSDLIIYGKIIIPGEVNEIDLLTKSDDGNDNLIYKDLIEEGLVKCSHH